MFFKTKHLIGELRTMSKYKQALKNARKKFSDEYIYQVVTADGKKIKDYFIELPALNSLNGLIYYWWNGQIWIMLNNDDFNLVCIDFLRRNGARIFTDDTDLKKYETELKASMAMS